VTTYAERLNDKNLASEINLADVVIDGTDNFSTRFSINNACVENKTPLVSGAAIRMEGQVSVFNKTPDSPCYNCLYKDEGELDKSCSSNGVLSQVVGIIGSIKETEAKKILLDIGDCLAGKLLILDALHKELRKLKLQKQPKCKL